MKKITTLILTISILLCCTLSCYAQSVDSNNLGISFTLSDDWVKDIDQSDEIGFSYYKTRQESVVITAIDAADWAWSLEFAEEHELKHFCEDLYSDSTLAKELAEKNNIFVTVKTNYVTSNYEYYNNVQYFRYEKAYTASAEGYLDTLFYDIAFVTAKNGKLYIISYSRDNESNHFADVVNMLNSMSYSNGEVKIKIDGERIYPDSAPMIIAGRTLVPIRAVAEKMGYSVSWDGVNSIVTLVSEDGSNTLHFGIGYNVAVKNDSEEIKLDVPPVIVNGRTYLPLRAVAEAMDANVNWNGSERTVLIAQK